MRLGLVGVRFPSFPESWGFIVVWPGSGVSQSNRSLIGICGYPHVGARLGTSANEHKQLAKRAAELSPESHFQI